MGKINNLITSDLKNITEGRDFLFLGQWLVLYAVTLYIEPRDSVFRSTANHLWDDVPLCDSGMEVSIKITRVELFSPPNFSSLVGLAVMVILMPVPAKVSSLLAGVQKAKMKAVRAAFSLILLYT